MFFSRVTVRKPQRLGLNSVRADRQAGEHKEPCVGRDSMGTDACLFVGRFDGDAGHHCAARVLHHAVNSAGPGLGQNGCRPEGDEAKGEKKHVPSHAPPPARLWLARAKTQVFTRVTWAITPSYVDRDSGGTAPTSITMISPPTPRRRSAQPVR